MPSDATKLRPQCCIIQQLSESFGQLGWSATGPHSTSQQPALTDCKSPLELGSRSRQRDGRNAQPYQLFIDSAVVFDMPSLNRKDLPVCRLQFMNRMR